jgi:hypothetical protein
MWTSACISLHLKNTLDVNWTQHYSSQIQPNITDFYFPWCMTLYGFYEVNKDDDDPVFMLKWAVLPRLFRNTLPLYRLK